MKSRQSDEEAEQEQLPSHAHRIAYNSFHHKEQSGYAKGVVLQSGTLRVTYSDSEINARLRSGNEPAASYSAHFSQNEEFFVRLPDEIEVPSFPVHHDLDDRAPGRELARAVRHVVAQIQDRHPDLIGGLTHLFDPSNNARPGFFRLYRLRDITYLYLVQLDLTYRPKHSRLVERTTNAATARYRTRDVFLEADLYPLVDVETDRKRVRALRLEQSISDTWIGETGRGYMRAGMWLDRDLTKFFSRLFVPPDVHTYPYFPFTCKYRTIAHSVIDFSDLALRRSVQLLHRARETLLPHLREIEDSLRSVQQDGFTEELPAFRRIKESIDASWQRPWERFEVRRYLNEEDEREFEIEHGPV